MEEAINQYIDSCMKKIIAETEAKNNIQYPQDIKEIYGLWFKMGAESMRTYAIALLGGKQ